MAIGPSTRAANVDRERVIGLLQTQLAAGTLSAEEFSARAAVASRARTLGELDQLTQDLPVPVPSSVERTTSDPLRGMIVGALVAVAAFLLILVVVLVVLGVGATTG
ncbi:DUF1707 SHOCT-like domain-containing protein [Nocardia uniformis]|nr:DUF1707 domain-containing protein [Nocardia uniformis]